MDGLDVLHALLMMDRSPLELEPRMDFKNISPEDRYIIDSQMDRAQDVIALIPDVKPRLALSALLEAAQAGGSETFRLAEGEERIAVARGWGTQMSPVGGRLLRALFDEGKIPQKPPRGTDLSRLDEYIAGEDAFRCKIAEKIAAAAARRQRIQEIADNPDCAKPEEITSDLIDKVFLKVHGYGHYGTMRIGGLECHKSSTPRRYSNSGKTSTQGSIYCWWIDAEGEHRGQDAPREFLNRRNDPDRNWGLGRE
jgi:hypothetical protein